jgi:exosortase/archaeosortase family protein
LLFELQWGLVGKGGRFYSPFIFDHLNFIHAFSSFLTNSAYYLLEIIGYNSVMNNFHTLRIENSRGVVVNPSCLGWGVMSFWIAFVSANTGTFRRKLKWIAVGLAAILSLNIFRIALIALANHHQWDAVTSLDHHTSFNIASYSCIFLLLYIFIKNQKQIESSYYTPARSKIVI